MFSFTNKPNDWMDLPLYKKIEYTGTLFPPQIVQYVDKIQAKTTVIDMLGSEIKVQPIIKILSDYTDVTETDFDPDNDCTEDPITGSNDATKSLAPWIYGNINEEILCDMYYIKSNFGTGFNINVNHMWDIDRIRNRLISFEDTYNYPNQIQYSYITPRRYFIEQKINDRNFDPKRVTTYDGKAMTYMIYCIYGNPFAYSERYEDRENKYYLNRTEIELNIRVPVPRLSYNTYHRMVQMAKILAEPFEFVRMDFFIDQNNDIYFSEYTFTPKIGQQIWNMDIEIEFGNLWTVNPTSFEFSDLDP